MATEDLHQSLEKATVKIWVANEFKGTGFFITSKGYVLTAYHCVGKELVFSQKIGKTPPDIFVETHGSGKFQAQLEMNKSLESSDIAVLKVEHQTTECVPLGRISNSSKEKDIVALGYPAGHRPENQEIATYIGKLSRFCTNQQFETEAIKGQGQSGGPVYHYQTRRVIGLAVSGYDPNETKVFGIGRAAQFDDLFQRWPALEAINEEVAKAWEKRCYSSASELRKLTREEKQKIVNALLKFSNMSDRNERLVVLRQLSPKIFNNIRDASQSRLHVINIVETCLDYTEGMTELVEVLRDLEDDPNSIPMQALDEVLKEIYHR